MSCHDNTDVWTRVDENGDVFDAFVNRCPVDIINHGRLPHLRHEGAAMKDGRPEWVCEGDGRRVWAEQKRRQHAEPPRRREPYAVLPPPPKPPVPTVREP